MPGTTTSASPARPATPAARLRAGLLAALAAVGLLLSACSVSGTASLGTEEFLALTEEPGVVVLDVRTPQEFAEGHLEGARNLDVEDPDFGTAISKLDPAATYAIYCRTGRRASVASDAMTTAGFTDLNVLDGGIADLQAAGAPIVTG